MFHVLWNRIKMSQLRRKNIFSVCLHIDELNDENMARTQFTWLLLNSSHSCKMNESGIKMEKHVLHEIDWH